MNLVNPHRFPAAGGASYDFEENFEGSEVCSRSVSGYDNTGWVVNTGGTAPDPNYATSPAPLEGTGSLYLSNAARTAYNTLTASDNYYMYLQHVLPSYSSANDDGCWAAIQDSSGNSLAELRQKYTDICAYTPSHGLERPDNNALTTAVIHYWLEYEKGSGADAVCRVYYSTDGTKPGSPAAEITDGTETAQAARIYLAGRYPPGIFDKIKVSYSTPIGSNP